MKPLDSRVPLAVFKRHSSRRQRNRPPQPPARRHRGSGLESSLFSWSDPV